MQEILFICPYDSIYPPMNGGMLRCFHILHQLALHFKVTAIINQDKAAFEKALPSFPALTFVEIFSTKNEKEPVDLFSFLPYRIKNALRFRWYKRTFNATTDSNFLLYYPVLKKMLKKKRFDLVLLENLDTINSVDIIRRYSKNLPVFYDAHNVDSRLAEEKVAKGLLPLESAWSIKKTESNLNKMVDGLLTCSERDLHELKQMNGGKLDGQVIPNGVYLEETHFDEGVRNDNPRYIIFCGSLDYEPNAEGIMWFYNKVWPGIRKQFPALLFMIVGSGNLPGCLADLAKTDSSVYFTGRVEDVKPYYNKAAVAIVPLSSGSGTRLKIFEAMGLGLPVISTTKGAEGINYTNGENIIIADSAEQFSEEIILLLNNKEKRIALKNAAISLVAVRYNWDRIGLLLQSFINGEINKFKAAS